jgi:hypothetical protein
MSSFDVLNPRAIFDSRLRNMVVGFLLKGPLRGENSTITLKFADQVLAVKKSDVDTYLYTHDVNLLNMDEHLSEVMNKVIIPYLMSKRVQ